MPIGIEWFRVGPSLALHVDITGGVLSLTSSSQVNNIGDFPIAQVAGAIYKNGTSAASLTINGTTGAITSSSVNVSTGDHIEVRVEVTSPVSWPWDNRIVCRSSGFLDVPAGQSTIDFDGNTNVMPIPGLDLAFGWDANSYLKLGVKIMATDSASQDILALSRRPSAQETSTTIVITDSSVQTHTSSFTTSDITGEFELELRQRSGSGTTYAETRSMFRFTDKTQVAAYPAGFPSDQVKIKQTKAGGKLKLGAPGQ